MFKIKVGDHVVYPGHGVGKVINSESKEIFGKVQDFMTVQLSDNGMKIMLPSGNVDAVGLRKLAKRKEINEVFKDIEHVKHLEHGSWNMRYREYMEKVRTGSFREVCEVLKQLNSLKGEKELSFGERKMLETSKALIVSEVGLSLKMPIDEAEKFVTDKIG